jgi:RimJ/RimL family protein N-acetyltransferase
MLSRDDVSAEELLAAVTGSALLANGQPVDIAPATAADLPRVRAFYERLSPTASHYRFFGSRREVPEQELRRMVTCDVPQRVALLASTAGELIGIGEYFADNEKSQAEVAFVVADDHHGEGIATLLLERLAVTAQRSGLRHFVAHTLADNHDMLLVFRTVGLAEQTHYDDGVIDVTLDLSTLDLLAASAEARRQKALLSERERCGAQ